MSSSPVRDPLGVGVVGCGYVSDFYLNTIGTYPGLRVVAVHDRDPDRAGRLGASYNVPTVASLDEMFSCADVSLVLNLTNPASHADVTAAALAAGRHVYSEKPLALTLAAGRALVDLAEQRGLALACSPANILGEALQTMWREVRRDAIGSPRLVYAQMDDGAIHLMNYETWVNGTGVPWPYRDEFATGSTMEHAAYHLQPLTTMFGPVRRVVSDVATLMEDKLPAGESGPIAADFSLASLTFASGVVARLTCGIVAPEDHSLVVVGDGGVMRLDDCWDYGSAITVRVLAGRRGRYLREAVPVTLVRPYRHLGRYQASHAMDFPRGVADLADAVLQGRAPRLSAIQALHVLEVELAILAGPGVFEITSSFPTPMPQPWAQ